MVYANGDMYTGAWKDNRPHDDKGEGEYIFAANKKVATGKWIEGKLDKNEDYDYVELKVAQPKKEEEVKQEEEVKEAPKKEEVKEAPKKEEPSKDDKTSTEDSQQQKQQSNKTNVMEQLSKALKLQVDE